MTRRTEIGHLVIVAGYSECRRHSRIKGRELLNESI
jgi:hypothetical protein